MNLPTLKTRFSFQAKVLIPVVCVMVLLTAVTVWLVNQRIGDQLDAHAAERLYIAKKQFRASRESRASDLSLRYRNLGDEPKIKSLIIKLCTEDAFQETVDFLMQSSTNLLTEAEAEKAVQKDQT